MQGKSFVWADREDVDYYDDDDQIINWHLSSQRLHFGEINNYKSIKALVLSAKGDTTQTAKISTKVFRDCYHPDKSEGY